jgi:hypothetical protein
MLLAFPVLEACVSGRARLALQNEDHLGHGPPPVEKCCYRSDSTIIVMTFSVIVKAPR